MTEDILYSLENGIATITINREHVLNALDEKSIRDLVSALEKANDDRDVLCVLLCAKGKKAFCVGGDINAEVTMDGYSAYDFGALGQHLMKTLRNLRTPVVTAMQGYSLGAGMEIMLASDFVFLSDNAKVSIPSINLGSMCGFGGSQMLPLAVGPMRAKEILMSGRHVGAEEAVSLGLALEAVPLDDLQKKALDFAKMLCTKAPFALRSIKTAVNKSQEMDLDTGFQLELNLFSRVQASEDKQKGMEAFLNKSKVDKFTNR